MTNMTFYRSEAESSSSVTAPDSEMGRSDTSRLACRLDLLIQTVWCFWAFETWWFIHCSQVCRFFLICFALCVAKELLFAEAVPDAWRFWSTVVRHATKSQNAKKMTDLPAWLLSTMKRGFFFFSLPVTFILISNRHAEGHPVCTHLTEKSHTSHTHVYICPKKNE